MNPSVEAVLNTVRTLEKEGHVCKEINMSDFKEFFFIYTRLMLSINLSMKNVGDEHLMEDYNSMNFSYKIPSIIKPFLSKILELMGETRKAYVLNNISNKSVLDFNHQCFLKQELAQKLEEMYKTMQLDVIISPVAPLPAIKHGNFSNLIY